MLKGSRLYYKTITCEKNSALCSVLQGNPAVASLKEKLYEQMTSNPAFTEKNIQKPNAYLLDSRPEQKSLVPGFGHISHSTVRNIPKFKDRANWSRDTFQPMRKPRPLRSVRNQFKHPNDSLHD